MTREEINSYIEDKLPIVYHLAEKFGKGRGKDAVEDLVSYGSLLVTEVANSQHEALGALPPVSFVYQLLVWRFTTYLIHKQPNLVEYIDEAHSECIPDYDYVDIYKLRNILASEASKVLTMNEQLVVSKLLGFAGKAHTTTEIGIEKGCLRSGVWNIYKRALDKLSMSPVLQTLMEEYV